MSDNPYESRDAAGESPARKSGTLVQLLVVLAVIGILVALLLPSVRTAREPARRMQCANNLKQIGLALHNYESEYHVLPPACTVDADGKPLHSWRTLILPYMEQQALYDKIDLSKPWDDPANKAAYDTVIPAYRCPSADCLPQCTTYLAVVAPGGCFQPTEPRKLAEITDDHDRTIMVVDVNAEHAVHWMSPADIGGPWISSLGTVQGLPHPRVVEALCVSGSVVQLSTETEAATLRALISIDGNDDAAAQEAD